MTASDHRTAHRVHFVSAATLHAEEADVGARLLDISLMGALLAVDALPRGLEVDGGCRLTLVLGPDVVLELAGRVVRAARPENRLAVKWEHMDVDSASHLRRLLELNLGDHDLIEQDIEAMYAAHVDADGR